MLTPASNLDDLITRLSGVPSAVQTSASAALAAYVRARTSGAAKAAAIKAYTERTRLEPLAPPGRGRGPRRGAAWEGEGTSGPRSPATSRNPSPYPLPRGERDYAVALAKAAAVRAALNALGRSS